MSVLIDRAAILIAEQHGGRPEPQRVEAALRAGRDHVLVLGQRLPLAPFLERAAPDACGLALEALRQALRREVSNVDLVLLTGGGAGIYGDQARALFPGAVVHVAHDPVTANARGFFRHGR
jgi:plasmid segregation protein ParM